MSRTEEKLLKKQANKKRAKNIAILLICFMLFITMIYVTDIKTSDMMIKKDGKHAVFFNIENQTDVRFDIAGETFRFNAKHVIEIMKDMMDWSKEIFNKIVNSLGS